MYIKNCNIRNIDHSLSNNHSTHNTPRLVRLLMTFSKTNTTYNNSLSYFFYNGTNLAFISTRNRDNGIALNNFIHHNTSKIHKTSGASETIFINLSERNSLVTGPNILVPIGSSLLFNKTAALLSNLINAPSNRRMPLAVRTTTALYTSPFFTRPRAAASLTATFIISPTFAYRRLDPPTTLMHITLRAPELSATSKIVCI